MLMVKLYLLFNVFNVFFDIYQKQAYLTCCQCLTLVTLSVIFHSLILNNNVVNDEHCLAHLLFQCER